MRGDKRDWGKSERRERKGLERWGWRDGDRGRGCSKKKAEQNKAAAAAIRDRLSELLDQTTSRSIRCH